jgi:hypothetical protein
MSSQDATAPADLVEAVREVLNQAYYLLDDTANDNPPEVPQDSWDNLAKAVETLGSLIPKDEWPCIIGVAARLIAGDTPKLDPRDAEIERLKAELIEQQAAVVRVSIDNAVATVAATDMRKAFFTSVSGGGSKPYLSFQFASMDEMHTAYDRICMFLNSQRFMTIADREALANSEGKA